MGKLQHFVRQRNLQPWTVKGTLYCLQNSKIDLRHTKTIAAENYFYQLKELNDEDIAFLRAAINDSPARSKPYHEQTISMFTKPYLVKHRLEALGQGQSKAMVGIDNLIREMNETWHTSIENDFHPL